MDYRYLVLPAALSLAIAAYPAPPPAVVGDYIEARSNHVYTCPCLYSGEQGGGGREAILAWSIRGGEFRGAALAGTRAVAVVEGEGNLGLDGMARRSVLFVDSGGSDARLEATVALLREYYGAVLGQILGVHAAPVSFEKSEERVIVSVGETARVVIRPARLPEDAHQGSFLWYDPFIPTTASALACTEYAKFSGTEFRHQWWERELGVTGFIGTFSVSR